MKKLLLIALIAVTMAGVAHAATAAPSSAAQPAGGAATAQTSASGNFVPLAPIPGLTQGVVANSSGLANFLNNLYKYLVGAAAILAVIMIIWGGLEISTKDSVSKKSDGKARITQAIFGLILVLSPVIVFSIINPSILNLSLNLPPIAISPGTYGGNGSGTTAGTQAQTTASNNNTVAAAAASGGCSAPTGTLLIKTTCPTQQAAQNVAAACPNGSGNVSSSLFSSQYQAECDTTSGPITGPYEFVDTATGAISYIVGYSNYEPLASTLTNPNNGADVLKFASTCTADNGTTCMSTVKLPCAASATACWLISLSCTDGQTGAGGCSSNPNFTVVNN